MSDLPNPPAHEPVAIIGMACRFPGAPDLDAFWQLLCAGQDAISEVPASRWSLAELYDPEPRAPGKVMTRWGGFLENLDLFDAAFFGISPREALHLDPRQRLMLELAWEALEDAGVAPGRLAGSRTGVFVATSKDDYSGLLFADHAQVEAYSSTGNAHSLVASRLSYTFGLQGPSMAIDSACSGSLVALHLACQSLHLAETDLALAGGVNVILKPDLDIAFSRAGALAPDGRCKSFDARANGFVRAEGAGLLVLKPLSRAQADGDRIYALVLGSAVNQAGRTNGIMAPSRPSQEAVLRAAYRSAGVAPAHIHYVEAHGTGTPLSDRVEVEALAAVLGPGRPAGEPCLLGAVKTNIGHTEAAAGVAGVIKVALALRQQRLPPNLHFNTPAPALANTPLRVVGALAEWASDTTRLAGVSSFGIGGTNAHVVLAEAPVPAATAAQPAPDTYLLPLSAHSRPALAQLARATAALLEAGGAPAGLCATAATRRGHLEQRVAVVGPDAATLVAQLRTVADECQRAGSTRAGAPAPLAWIFPGQGAGWAGMGRVLLAGDTAARAALLDCDQTLRSLVPWSLLEVLTTSEDHHLASSAVAQPAQVAVQIALAAQWRAYGVAPQLVAGQSLGEVAAAHAAGVLSLEDTLRIAVERGRLMQTLAGQGALALVGLPAERAQLVLTGFEDVLTIAGQISPTTSILSGEPAMLDRVLGLLGRRGIFCRRLAVDVAAHSAQMAPLQPLLEAALAGIDPQPAAIPLFSSVAAAPIDGRELGPAYWARNLREPFLVGDVLQQLIGQGAGTLIEISPHPILCRTCREQFAAAGRTGLVLPSLQRGDTSQSTMLAGLALLYSQNYELAWEQIAPRGAEPARLPGYPWQRERYWLDQLVPA